MATIVTRAGKGSQLTHNEVDANFTNLNTDKIELTNISVSTASASGAGALAYNNSTGAFTFTPSVPGTTTTINNNADNRIITGSGSANTLEGESTLQYDGTSLSNTTAPTFTEASVPIQLNGTQPNTSGYNVYKSINTQTSRGGQGYRSNTAAQGSKKVDTHTFFFDLDDDFGLRPGGSFQGDRNIWFQGNHTDDKLSVFFDGFSTNTIESFDGNNASYARTELQIHGSTTKLLASGTTALTATSSILTAGVDFDTDGNDIKLGGGTIDLEAGSITSTGGNIAFADNMTLDINSAGTVTLGVTNTSATGNGSRITVGTAGSAVHSSGDLLLARRATASGFQELFKVSSTGTAAGEGIVVMNNIDALTTQDTGTPSDTSTPTGYIELLINGTQRFIPFFT